MRPRVADPPSVLYGGWSASGVAGRLAVIVTCLVAPGVARAQDQGADPSCPAGRVTAVEIRNGSIFDPNATESSFLGTMYRAANMAHVRTREGFIRSELLLEEGDCFDPVLAEDSQLILDRHGFLRQAVLRAEDDGQGGRRLVVETSDEWSLGMWLGITYDEGVNLERVHVSERNFLGRGIVAEASLDQYRDRNDRALRLYTPRLFGRGELTLSWGRARRGDFLGLVLAYPFVGETGRFSLRQAYSRSPTDFTYATGGREDFTHVVVPVRREAFGLAAARRFGEPDRSTIFGISIALQNALFPGDPERVFGSDFGSGDTTDYADLNEGIVRHRRPLGGIRMAVHLGARHFRYQEFRGLDAVREEQTVGLGFFAGMSVGRGLGLLAPDGVPEDSDSYVRTHASFGRVLGGALFHGGTTVEARRGEGWRDILAEGDVVAYGRASWLPHQTVFARASFAGGWRVEVPFQLTLGGRDGVRSLHEDQFPGGREVVFTLEDRIALPWPRWGVGDLGATVFADLGRVWHGDVPYGVDSGWKGGVGIGLRIAVPSGSRIVLRPDVTFPLGPGRGDPIVRITVETNRIRAGFFTPELSRSRQFRRGPEHF